MDGILKQKIRNRSMSPFLVSCGAA